MINKFWHFVCAYADEKRLKSGHCNDAILESFARVFNSLGRISHEESEWIHRIESLRKQLSSSDKLISVKFYGPGDPSWNLTPEQMYEGTIVNRTMSSIFRRASLPHKYGMLFFKLIREFSSSVCLELGTSLGISCAYQAAALEINQKGRILTIEGSDSLAEIAKENWKNLGIERASVVIGRIQDKLEYVLHELSSVDFVFIDASHNEHFTMQFFQQISPYLSENSILVLDDISWYNQGMRRAWNKILADERIAISFDLYRMGICLFQAISTEGRGRKKLSFRISL